MSPETVNLIIGSVLGFSFSMIAMIVNNKYQSKREEQAREWEVQDKEREERSSILIKRKNQAEEYANHHLNVALQMYDFESELISSTFSTDFHEYGENKVKEIRKSTEDFYKNASCIYVIGDKELFNRSSDLHSIVLDEFKFIYALLGKKSAGNIDVDKELQRIAKFLSDIKESHEEYISRLDKLIVS